jgi:hypothetical protein
MARVALVLLAIVLTFPACGDGDPEEPADGTEGPTSALSSDRLPVLIVARPVPAGTEATAALGEGLLREDVVTRAQFPENAIVSIELVDGMVATQELSEGTIVLAGMFLPPAATSTDGSGTTTAPATAPASTADTAPASTADPATSTTTS